MRPPVESYCRATCEAPESRIETITGVEMRDPAEWFGLLAQSKALMTESIAAVTGSHQVANPAALAAEIRARIEATWPDRYWFLECAWGERDGWCQVYAPVSRIAELEERIDALESRARGSSNVLASWETRLREVEGEVIDPPKTVDGDDAPWAKADSLRKRLKKLEEIFDDE